MVILITACNKSIAPTPAVTRKSDDNKYLTKDKDDKTDVYQYIPDISTIENIGNPQNKQNDPNHTSTSINIDTSTNGLIVKYTAKLADYTDALGTYTSKLVFWTSVLAIVAIGQFCVMFYQYRGFRRIESARIFASIIDENKFREPRNEDIIKIRIYNHGRTLAILRKYRVEIKTIEKRERLGKLKFDESAVAPIGIFIKDGEGEGYPLQDKIIKISSHEEKLILNNKRKLICYGRIAYIDVFGFKHETGFCWEYNPDDHSFNISGSNHLNYNT